MQTLRTQLSKHICRSCASRASVKRFWNDGGSWSPLSQNTLHSIWIYEKCCTRNFDDFCIVCSSVNVWLRAMRVGTSPNTPQAKAAASARQSASGCSGRCQESVRCKWLVYVLDARCALGTLWPQDEGPSLQTSVKDIPKTLPKVQVHRSGRKRLLKMPDIVAAKGV